MAQIAGSPVQQCGEPEPPPVSQSSSDNSHWLQFRFRATTLDRNDDSTGYPIEDSEGFRLKHPSGSIEKGALNAGDLNRSGVPEGSYEMMFYRFKGCSWTGSWYEGEPTLTMSVDVEGFPDGTKIKFRVFGRFQSMSTDPLFQTSAAVSGGRASATWKYQQKVGQAAGGEFIFEATVKRKRAVSNCVTIRPYPLSMIRGVQQRLKELGLDCGPTDGVLGAKTKAAVKEFQSSHPPLKVDGIPGDFTKAQLAFF